MKLLEKLVISNFAPPNFRKVKPPEIGKVKPPIAKNVKRENKIKNPKMKTSA